MNVPLKIIENGQGQLRDFNNQPMILIFDSKPNRPRASRRLHSTKEKPKIDGPRPFAFINVKKPSEEDEGTRTLIRTHVMQDLRRKEREKNNTGLKAVPPVPVKGQISSGINLTQQNPPSHIVQSQTPVYTPSFVVFPIEMKPYMRKLIHQYATSILHLMDPKEPTNAKDSAWFPLVMSDPALFHMILSTSAMYIGFISGSGHLDSVPQRKHMLEAISLLNAKLKDINEPECVSNATMTTILFMAKVEYAQGNHKNWDIHMNGLKRILKLRGGMIMLPSVMREKIYRTELLGCIETGSKPRFEFIDHNYITIEPWVAPPSLSPGFQTLTQIYSFNRYLVAILDEVERLTYMIKIGMPSYGEIESTSIAVMYQLLSWTDTDQCSIDEPCSAVQEAVRFGAILYSKTLLPKPRVRGIDYTVMLSSLKSHIEGLHDPSTTNKHFLLWLLLISGIVSKTESPDRKWFAVRLRDVAAQIGISVWADLKLLLMSFWWIESTHDAPGHQFWEEVERSVRSLELTKDTVQQ